MGFGDQKWYGLCHLPLLKTRQLRNDRFSVYRVRNAPRAEDSIDFIWDDFSLDSCPSET